MYRLSLQRDFEARHYLIGGDWGVENVEHGHPYRLEWILDGGALDEHGYLVDLVELEAHLETTLRSLPGRVLNELPEFAGLNPSLENFARILATRLGTVLDRGRLPAPPLRRLPARSADRRAPAPVRRRGDRGFAAHRPLRRASVARYAVGHGRARGDCLAGNPGRGRALPPGPAAGGSTTE